MKDLKLGLQLGYWGAGPNPDMVKVVKGYEDAQLIAVVDYMSRLEWPERTTKE